MDRTFCRALTLAFLGLGLTYHLGFLPLAVVFLVLAVV